MIADDDELAAAGELDRRKLLLVVPFKGWAEFSNDVGCVDCQVLDICRRGKVLEGGHRSRGSLGASWGSGVFMPAITSASYLVRGRLV